MAKNKPAAAFSPEDMKRRRGRSIATALALVAFIVIIFVTTVYKIKAGVGG